MFHPVGSQPPAVYWRRRLVLVAAAVILLVLLVMTVKAIASDGDKPVASNTPPVRPTTNAPPANSTSAAATSPAAPSSSTSEVDATHSTTPATGGSASTSNAPGGAAPAACLPTQLRIVADPGKPVWKVGDEPALALQVTNTAATACVQDVSDSQIELRVYNGASRVWGSHDCLIQPGTVKRTLLPGAVAGFTVTWSGMSSRPNCAGTRQRVGAGSYTLYASLAGRDGTAATFRIK